VSQRSIASAVSGTTAVNVSHALSGAVVMVYLWRALSAIADMQKRRGAGLAMMHSCVNPRAPKRMGIWR
jgi:hypothetical protein